jgi:hypothetical protein
LSRLEGHRFGLITIGAVICRLGTLISRLTVGRGWCVLGRRALLHFRRGARFVGFQTGIRQPGDESDKNAELDSN